MFSYYCDCIILTMCAMAKLSLEYTNHMCIETHYGAIFLSVKLSNCMKNETIMRNKTMKRSKKKIDETTKRTASFE